MPNLTTTPWYSSAGVFSNSLTSDSFLKSLMLDGFLVSSLGLGSTVGFLVSFCVILLVNRLQFKKSGGFCNEAYPK